MAKGMRTGPRGANDTCSGSLNYNGHHYFGRPRRCYQRSRAARHPEAFTAAATAAGAVTIRLPASAVAAPASPSHGRGGIVHYLSQSRHSCRRRAAVPPNPRRRCALAKNNCGVAVRRAPFPPSLQELR